MRKKYISLFAGAAGGDLAVQHLLGWECMGYVEWDKYCCRVLGQRIKDGLLSDAPVFCGDIRRWIELGYAAAYQGLVDGIIGGFPCQPFSNAGKQLGAADERNMWPATIDAIRIIRPHFCLLENVAALLTNPYFGTILGDLAKSGYCVRWRRLSAAEVGAPHKRDRVWIVAYTEEQHRSIDRRQAFIPGRLGQIVADASIEGVRRLPVQPGGQNEKSADANRGGENVSVTSRQRLEKRQGAAGERAQPAIGRGDRWAVEPDVGRMVDGLAYRVDRVRALGNGQVPAVVAAAWHLLTNEDGGHD